MRRAARLPSLTFARVLSGLEIVQRVAAARLGMDQRAPLEQRQQVAGVRGADPSRCPQCLDGRAGERAATVEHCQLAVALAGGLVGQLVDAQLDRRQQRRVRVVLPKVGPDAPQVGRLKPGQHVLPPLLIAAANHRAGHSHPEREPVQALADRLGRQPVQLGAPAAGPVAEQFERLLHLKLGHRYGHRANVVRQADIAAGEQDLTVRREGIEHRALPHVVEHHQHPPPCQQPCQHAASLASVAKHCSIAEALGQVTLQPEHAGAGIDRQPRHPATKPPTHRAVVRGLGGQHRLARPAHADQSHGMAVAAHQRLDQPRKLTASHNPRRPPRRLAQEPAPRPPPAGPLQGFRGLDSNHEAGRHQQDPDHAHHHLRSNRREPLGAHPAQAQARPGHDDQHAAHAREQQRGVGLRHPPRNPRPSLTPRAHTAHSTTTTRAADNRPHAATRGLTPEKDDSRTWPTS